MKIHHGTVGFIEPMLAVAVTKLPEGAAWSYELKFDGYHAISVKATGQVRLFSRNDKDFTRRFASVARALEGPPGRYRSRWRDHRVRHEGVAFVQRPAEPSRQPDLHLLPSTC